MGSELDSSETAVSVVDLVKVYRGARETAVNHISFQVGPHDILGLLGPNGAGKTTIIGILCGLLRPNGGRARICGYDICRYMRKIKPLIGLVPQDIALYPSFTADENLRIFGGLSGLSRRQWRRRSEDLLEKFGLSQHRYKKVADYSGGMQRRLNLIAALLHRPRVLFLDEPTVGIDVQSKVVIMDNLVEISRQGTAMIYTSHQMEEAQTFCSHLTVIDRGRLVAEGRPQELIEQTSGARNLEEVYLSLTGRNIEA